MVSVFHPYCLTVTEFMPRSDHRPRRFLPTSATVDLDRLVERRHYAKWPDPLGKGRKFDGRSEVIAGGPGFMRDHDRVHDLLRPCVLNLERLLVFDRFWDKGSQQRDHFVRL
jgi:hypothetical protein